jgi:predicted MFS family arabinose efflux permease
VFAVGEFRALFVAHLQSVLGDQLARVALAVLVFDRTGSPGLAALTYALTFIPDLVGGPLLAGLADRYPRRALMVQCDLARAALVGVMAIPGMSILALCALLLAVQLAGAPFKAARAAVVPAILAGDRFVVGNGIMNSTFQVGLLGGFAAGAPLVAWTGTGWALVLDAATFAVSAVLIGVGLRPHLPRETEAASSRRTTTLASLRAGSRLVWRDRQLRVLLAMACLAGFYVVPMGLAVPYAAQIGEGTAAVGLLLAADPAGTALGAVLLTRLVPPEWRLRLLGPMAVATSAVLLPSAVAPGLWVTVGLWMVCGLLGAHDTVTSATFQRAVPDHSRGQVYGLASAALRAAQGLGIALAGLLAEVSSPATAIAVFATVGVVAGSAVAVGWHRVRSVAADVLD